MTEEILTESELVRRFRAAATYKRALEGDLFDASAECETLKQKLIETLTAQDKTETATYEGVGYATLAKPAVRASYMKENEEQVFSFLRGIHREDLIKVSINDKSLSGFVRERLEKSEEIPSVIKYYLQPQVFLYSEDGKRLG